MSIICPFCGIENNAPGPTCSYCQKIIDPKHPDYKEPTESDKTTIKCPSCGEENPNDLMYCRRCDRELGLSEKEKTYSSKSGKNRLKIGINHIIWLKILVIFLLLFALLPNPYGYYILLRWLCCSIFIYFAVSSYQIESKPWIWIYGVSSGIYNPIIPAHLGREVWSVVNVITIVILIVSFAKDRLSAKKKS